MALNLSTGARNFLLGQGSFKEAFADSVLKIYSGNAPAASGSYGAADVVPTGTLLVTLTRASGTITAYPADESIPQMCKCTGVGTSGTASITLNGNVYATTSTSSAAVAMLALSKLINRTCPEFMATVENATGVMFLVARCPANSGSVYTVVDSSTTFAITVNSSDMHTFTPGDGLQFAAAASGAIAKQTAAWSGTAVATATAGYWRLVRATEYAAEAQSLTAIRLQGTCGVGSGDILMSTTAIVTGASQTVDSFSIELPATI
jgi:hypothetical protein